MIIGAHSIVYSANAEADRLFLRDVLKLTNDVYEFYLMCDDLNAFITELKKHNVAFEPAEDQGLRHPNEADIAGWRQTRCLSTSACTTSADGHGEGQVTWRWNWLTAESYET